MQGQRGPRTGGGGAAHNPATAAQEQQTHALHAPYSHMLWCNSKVQAQCRFQVANNLCTDIAGVSRSSVSATAAVQVTVEVHAASWDVRQYILSQLQQPAPAGQQQGQLSTAQAGSHTPGPKVFGPYAATLSGDKSKNLIITQLQYQHEPQTYLQHLAGKPHCVVLQEQVPGSEPPHFKMHLKPGTRDKPANQHAKAISRAGEGPGLQVAPGSVSQVSNPGDVSQCGRASRNRVQIKIPKVLICSQLPADATYTLDISLRVLPPPDGQEGQWTARVCPNGKMSSWFVRLGPAHPLSAYVGRSISKMSLSQDRQLTLTFASAALSSAPAAHAQNATAAAPNAGLSQGAQPAAAAPVVVATSASAQQLSRKRRSGSTCQQQPPTEHVPGGGGTSAAAAAVAAGAGGVSGQTGAVTRKKPRQTNQHQQQQAAAAEASFVQELKRSAGQTARAQRAAGRAAMAAAVDTVTPPAAMPRKKRRPTQQQQEEPSQTTDAAAAATAEPPSAPVPIKQEPDSSTPAAANTGLLFWHLGEISSNSSSNSSGGSSEDESDRDSQGGDAGPGAPAPAADVDSGLKEAVEPPPPAAPEPVCTSGASAEPQAAAAAQPPEPSAAHAAPAAVEPPAPATPHLLPAGLTLADAGSPSQMEVQLVRLMTEGLRGLLSSEQYTGLMRTLRQTFVPVRGAATAEQVEQLQCGYSYVQAAVEGRQLADVVEALEALSSGG